MLSSDINYSLILHTHLHVTFFAFRESDYHRHTYVFGDNDQRLITITEVGSALNNNGLEEKGRGKREGAGFGRDNNDY